MASLLVQESNDQLKKSNRILCSLCKCNKTRVQFSMKELQKKEFVCAGNIAYDDPVCKECTSTKLCKGGCGFHAGSKGFCSSCARKQGIAAPKQSAVCTAKQQQINEKDNLAEIARLQEDKKYRRDHPEQFLTRDNNDGTTTSPDWVGGECNHRSFTATRSFHPHSCGGLQVHLDCATCGRCVGYTIDSGDGDKVKSPKEVKYGVVCVQNPSKAWFEGQPEEIQAELKVLWERLVEENREVDNGSMKWSGPTLASERIKELEREIANLHSSKPVYLDAYLNQHDAKELDQELFNSWDVAQLMELAGLSVACAVQEVFPPGRILIIAGKGNNGGDGIVAARHLCHFGFQPEIVYPKVGQSLLFTNLVKQVTELGIPITTEWNTDNDYDIILDAVFGFSFRPKGGIRAPYDTLVQGMRNTTVPVVSIDVPSGWDVELGDVHNIGVKPSVLVSLTAPKLFAKELSSTIRHFIGGRFLSHKLASKYNLTNVMSLYRGGEQIVELKVANKDEEEGKR